MASKPGEQTPAHPGADGRRDQLILGGVIRAEAASLDLVPAAPAPNAPSSASSRPPLDGVTVLDTLQYTYDWAGRLLTAGNDQGNYAFSYDATGRVLTVQEPFGLTLTFTYDEAGDRTRHETRRGSCDD